MARRLDKIEKDIGYCEIKLEKERRLRKQIQFLQDDVELLDRLVGEFTRRGVVPPANGGLEDDGAGMASRKGFLAVGLVEMLQEERDILNRERDDLGSRLRSLTGFLSKREVLEEEKRKALKHLSPAHSSKLRRINDDLKRVEKQWNSFSEDLVNLDEGIFFLDRNLDYLRSCRAFLISSKGNMDLDLWMSRGSLANLFRHSSLGRSKEMAEGADRNLKMAQKELVCLSAVKVRADLLQKILLPFLEALFEDIFIEGKLENSLRVIEAALAANLKLTEAVKEKRIALSAKFEQVDKLRNEMFSRIGSGRGGRQVE